MDSSGFDPLKVITVKSLSHPLSIVNFDDAKFDVYMVPGFLNEKWYLPYGSHSITSGRLAESDWLKQLVPLAQKHQFNLYLYHWPSGGHTMEFIKDHNIALLRVLPFLIQYKPIKILALPVIIKYLNDEWCSAIAETDSAAKRLSHELVNTKQKTIILGHSLGGRITLKMAALQSENDMKHFKYISLAPAICESELNLHSLASVSNQTEIFYSRADKILAWLFKLGQKKLENPIGLVGYKKETSIGKLINCTNMAYKKNMGHTDYEENLLRLLIESAIFSEIIKETT